MLSNQELSDQLRIERMLEGDKEAFRQVFDKYYTTLLTTAVNMFNDISTAGDITREVFFELWKTRTKFEKPDSMPEYLKEAIITRALNLLKRENDRS